MRGVGKDLGQVYGDLYMGRDFVFFLSSGGLDLAFQTSIPSHLHVFSPRNPYARYPLPFSRFGTTSRSRACRRTFGASFLGNDRLFFLALAILVHSMAYRLLESCICRVLHAGSTCRKTTSWLQMQEDLAIKVGFFCDCCTQGGGVTVFSRDIPSRVGEISM